MKHKKQFGWYVKQRGWIKTVIPYERDIICCRYAGDIHKEFIFKKNSKLTDLKQKYPEIVTFINCELREIPKGALIDKRVIPSKKWKHIAWTVPPFKLKLHSDGFFHQYCPWCNLLIVNSEYTDDNICIHCMLEFYNTLKVHYDDMDDDIKKSWERAKILDEI